MASYSHDLLQDSHKKITLTLLHKFSQKPFYLKLFSWTLISDLKRKIEKEIGIPYSVQRLFLCTVELTKNQQPLTYYSIDANSELYLSEMPTKENIGIIKPIQIFESHCENMEPLFFDLRQAFNVGITPKLTENGTSGTYLLQNIKHQNIAIFKPFEEEPFTPKNPRGYTGRLYGPGFRKGILAGESADREVAAYLLDGDVFGVPPTTFVEMIQFQNKNNKIDTNLIEHKRGSLQVFIDHDDICGNYGSKMFNIEEVQKIAILDMRILNCDRNEENILVKKIHRSHSKTIDYHLIPIDHGLSFPDRIEICSYEMVWMEWNQVKDQITPACQSLIESFDIYKDLQILTSKLQFRKSCLRNFCSATLLLKSGCKNGLTLHEIGSLLYREDEDEPSVIENLLKKTEELTKLLKPDIAINLMKVKKFAVRKNSIDEWIIVDKCENENLEIEKSESNFDESTNNTFSKKDSSNEKGINLFHDEKKINKELIVDDEWIQITKPKEKKNHVKRNISLPKLSKMKKEKKEKSKESKEKNGIIKKSNKKNKKTKFVKPDDVIYDQVFFYYFESQLEQLMVEKLKARKKHRNRFCSTEMMLAPYTQNNQISRSRSNAPVVRRSYNEPLMQMDPFFSDFGNHQMEIFKEFDNFSNNMFKKIEKHFGFGNMGSSFFDDFDRGFPDMENFSNLHNKMKGQGTVIQKSYVSSTKMDNNGKKVQEKYYQNNVAHRGADGNTISEKHEAYRNTGLGLDRIAQERMLNDKGRKFIQERNRYQNEEKSHNLYYNIDENEKLDFDNRWDQYNNKVGFHQNHMKYLKPNSNYRYIADNQSDIDSKRDYKDNNRRGDYVPSYKKYEDQPIRFSKPRTNDLQPIMLGGGQEPLPLNNAPYQPNFINNQRVPIAQNRNNAVGREGIFRNRIIARNEIPKAG